MRHPVSSRESLVVGAGGVVQLWVVGGAVGPGSPEDAYPGTSEDADGVRMVAATALGAPLDIGGRGRAVPGVVGAAGDRRAPAVIAGPSEDDATAFAGSPDGASRGDRTAASTIGLAGQKGLHPLLAEARGRCRGRVALHEGQGDGRMEIGENGHGAGPEALQQAAQSIGQADALGDQVVTAAHQGTRRLDVVRTGPERSAAMAVGAQDVGQYVGVTRIALAAGGAFARAAGFEHVGDHVGVDRHHRMACFDQRSDDQPRWALDRNGDFAGRRQVTELSVQFGEAGGVVRDVELESQGAGLIDDADSMAGTSPIEPSKAGHGQSPLGCATLPSVGRSCGTLIHWRSGPHTLALHPVTRRVLPAPAMRRVSSWPFAGKRRWPSWRVLGSGRAFHPACGVKSSTSTKVPE